MHMYVSEGLLYYEHSYTCLVIRISYCPFSDQACEVVQSTHHYKHCTQLTIVRERLGIYSSNKLVHMLGNILSSILNALKLLTSHTF